MLQNRVIFPLASKSAFGAAIFDAVALSSLVFCNSVSADGNVMAASRLLGATAACVNVCNTIVFAAGYRKSYWSGCIKAAIVICHEIFSSLALVIFLLKFLLRSASKSSSFCCGAVLVQQFRMSVQVILLISFVFCNAVCGTVCVRRI